MSQEIVEVVRQTLENWNRGDLYANLEYLDDDVVLRAAEGWPETEVVVPNTAHFRGRDGIEVVARATFVYTVENGLITRLRMFQEHAEALEAAGLSE